MKRKNLQEIEDYYIRLGYSNEKLRRALEKDREYQKLLKKRGKQLAKQFSLTPSERRKYVLSTNDDYEILATCRDLQRTRLTPGDRILVSLIKKQLELGWRGSLLQALNKLERKYRL